ncbi:MAG: methionine adenosyltransferase [Halomonas sp.]|nr:methionine adenosyltransferase [Halomonas sp.]MDZ7854188.1 methionine adenosyltransferase [Halomonas sp.]
MSRTYLFTSESVSEGHPDKLADRISDAILDRCREIEPEARVACETLVTPHQVVVAGELGMSSSQRHAQVLEEIPSLTRRVLRDTGYSAAFPGIDPEGCEIQVLVNRQSAQIAGGVARDGGEVGAGDQGLMVGYACDETETLMPLPIHLAHQLMLRHRQLRKSRALPWLRPDAKAQVTVRYRGDEPVAVETVVLSTQHDESVSSETIEQAVIRELIEPVIPEGLRSVTIRYLINPAGRFEIGGPQADAGLTGRKIIVDTYGGRCPHGGGAFSGKDPTKVDRSGAYAARWVAKHLVAAGLARRVTIQLAYVIGRPDPVSLLVDSHGTGKVPDEILERAVRETFDLSVTGILNDLSLQTLRYYDTAAFGHVGREDIALPWEQTPRLRELKEAAGVTRRPPPDQQRLSRFLMESRSSQGLSDEMAAWWDKRY